MAEERKVAVDLEVTKSGETGAFKETAGEVRELKEEAAGAAPELEDLGDAAADAGDAAGDAGKNIDDMGGAAAGAGSKLGSLATTMGAVITAFTTGYQVGTQFRSILNDLSSGGFDRGMQSMLTSVLGLNDGLDTAEDAAQRFANGLRILRNQGIDPTGKSAEEVAALVEKLSRASRDSAAMADDAAAAQEKWNQELGLSLPTMDAAADKLADFARGFERWNQQLSEQDLGEIFGPMIQDVLDSYERLGVEVPPRIKAMADSWGVLSTAGRKAANETKKIVDDMVADITGAAAGLKGSLETQLETLNEVFAKLDFGSFGAEQIQKAKTFLQQYVDTSRKAGVQIPEDVADQAAALGILVGQMEIASKGAGDLAVDQNAVAGAARSGAVSFDQATRSLKTLEGEVKTSSVEFDKSTGVLKTVATAVGASTVEYDKATGTLRTIKTAHVDMGKAATDAGADVKEGATKAGEGKTALEQAGKAAGDAGTGLDAAKKGAEGLGAAGSAAQTAATNLKTPLDQVATAAGLTGTALGTINEVKYTTAMGELNAVLSKLKEIETQAHTTAAALAAIDEDGPVNATPSPPGTPSNSGGGGGGGF